MDYARQQRDPTKHAIGIVFVVGMHLLLIWALLSGLGKAVVEVIKKPLSATIVEEIKAPPPPPPPPKKIVSSPKPAPPLETYVPPPDIPVPTTQAPGHLGRHADAAAARAVRDCAPRSSRRRRRRRRRSRRSARIRSACRGEDLVYPRAAIRAGVEKGRVVARVMIDEKGNVTDVIIVSADPPRVFDRTVIDGVKDWKYAAEGEKYVAEIEVIFQLEGIARDPISPRSARANGRVTAAVFAGECAAPQSSRNATAAAAQVATPSATTPAAIPASDTRCPTMRPRTSCATSNTVPGKASAMPRPAAAQSAVSAGLRQAGSAAGAGSAAITRAVNPASSM